MVLTHPCAICLLFVVACLMAGCGGAATTYRSSAPALGALPSFTESQWQRIEQVQPAVAAAARAHRLSPALINGVIWVESRFDVRARGSRGPRGLMQLMPRTGRAMAQRLGRRYAPHDAAFNVAAGTTYLMLMYRRFGALDLALAAYNAGPVAVVRWQRDGSPPQRPRRRYVASVLRAAEAFCVRMTYGQPDPVTSPFRCPAAQSAPALVASRR